MLKNKHLKEWAKIVSYHFPHLSLPEVAGLATWSFGMVMTGSSSLTRVSEFIGRLNQDAYKYSETKTKGMVSPSRCKTWKKKKSIRGK